MAAIAPITPTANERRWARQWVQAVLLHAELPITAAQQAKIARACAMDAARTRVQKRRDYFRVKQAEHRQRVQGAKCT